MTAVTIRPTFSKDTRPGNGLENIAPALIANTGEKHYVVGVVTFAGGSVDVDGAITPAVKFLGIEPLEGAAADEAKRILDQARKGRGLGRIEEMFTASSKEMEGQTAFEFASPDDADGERQVPEASAEELMAEREEAKAAAAKAPKAEFSGTAK